jgi:hypothetical protein
MERTLESMLVEQCAPTLAGVKPASLFRYQPKEEWCGEAEIFRLKRVLARSGMAIRVLKTCRQTGACMIYLYRIEWLRKILREPAIRTFLQGRGYGLEDGLGGLLLQLSQRLCLELDYPHEIGVFLGYPLEDVKGFIANRGRNYTCCGYWKVYGDPEAAQRRFTCYRRCTVIYRERYRRGASLPQLIVAA